MLESWISDIHNKAIRQSDNRLKTYELTALVLRDTRAVRTHAILGINLFPQIKHKAR